MVKMDICRHLSLLACCLLTANLAFASQGPVFIKPDGAPIAIQPTATKQGNYVTQTVYGFLDFTTTIGNTVMVFSPQSAETAIPEPPKPAKDISSNNVIETKPNAPKKEVEIKPTKTQTPIENKPPETTKKVSSVVQVQSNPSPTKVEVKSSPSVKINVIEGKPSTNVPKSPVVVSKVQVVEAPASKPSPNVITKVEVVGGPTKLPKHHPIIASKVEVHTGHKEASKVVHSVVQVKSDEEPAVVIGNNIGEPEYDFLSRQPSEVVEETYKVINLKPSSKFHLKHRPSTDVKKAATKRSDAAHPTGLVTKLGGTVVKDGVTTVHETSVIGTYISGKYAQVLQSTSQIINNQKGRINPSPSLRILKTAAPTLGKGNKHHRHLEPTPAGAINQEASVQADAHQNSIKSTRKPSGPGSSFKRFKNRHKEPDVVEEIKEPEAAAPQPSYKKSQKNRNQQTQGGRNAKSPGRWQYKTTSKPRVTIRKQNNDELASNNGDTLGTTSSSLQEASQPQINDVVTPQARSDDVDSLEGSESIASIIDDESSTENKLDTPAFPIETIKVEISTPPDLTDIYYEIATIKTPYTFQVGSMKNTRYITVTSTFEKSFETPEPTSTKRTEPLTENILATSSNYAKDNNYLDSSIATLPPIYLASDMETPPLETLTETFSTTQTMLKTHILPVVRNGNDTTSSTLVQTYIVTRVVTASKTLPPMDAYNFIPSKTLNEFNSHLDEAGSELHLELEFGDQNDQEDGQLKKVAFQDLDLANIGSDFDLSDVDKSKLEGHLRLKKAHAPQKPTANELVTPALNPDQLQQLALLRLLNPAAAQGQVITTSKPVLKVETVYETHVLPVTQGQNTILSTISKIKGTFTKTDFEFGTSTIAPALPIPPLVPQIPQLPQIPQIPQIPQLNPFLPQAQPQFAVTSSPVTQSTVITQTNSKVLKLTFGAKTAQTTVFSTTVVPTVLTSYVTASVPVAPTAAAFPGYYPQPFPAGYPYVG
ncbi:uncharacterized protein LOC108909279 isoform X2 [Anoplophora glabripennis]|uniref:uncharacterized protein LOC108909279 isoform X2 n=1 Tax=Anoplophora glabripennis TaxID=217634 RepID=UPI00087598CE|nr:uncharacterized protein LOC108909279 isoform X2 [Anoplophora glabripennis]